MTHKFKSASSNVHYFCVLLRDEAFRLNERQPERWHGGDN